MPIDANANKKLDLISIGDLIIDFTCLGESDSGMLLFERNPGGAPMNVAAQLARLGGRAGVVANVGDDEHGRYLRDLMRDMGIDVTNLLLSPDLGTRLMFVYFKEGNDRWFSDYKSARADLEIPPDQVDYAKIGEAKVLLCSPLCNTYTRSIYAATCRAREVAVKSGAMLAFDVNYRFPYTDAKLRQLDLAAIRSAHILKMTSEEFKYYLDEDDIMRGTEALLSGNARIVAVSMGKDGCFLRTKSGFVYQPTYEVEVKDTTGAGDSFMGALIFQLTRPGVDIDALTTGDLERMADFANACAALSTTRRGALLVMPDLAMAEEVRKNSPKLPPNPPY